MTVELILWHEPVRLTHAEAAAKTEYDPHPSVSAFAAEAGVPDGGSHLRLSVKDSAVPRIRYLAGKHRLVCFDVARQAVLNPPLLRRSGAYELAFCVGHSIDDPTPEHLAAALRDLDEVNWFVVLDDGDDHYVQAALTGDGYLLEVRDGSADKHFQVVVGDVEEVIAAFQEQARGDTAWRDRFSWHPVTSPEA